MNEATSSLTRTEIDWLEGKIMLDNIIIKITLLKNGKNT